MNNIAFILLSFIVLSNSYGQSDSTWNLVILKKQEKLEIKDHMAEYSKSGFYLYRNCFYDLKLKDDTKHTLRLVDIQLDTLVFIEVSQKRDTNWSLTSKDTIKMRYDSIDKLLLLRQSMGKSAKKIKCENHHFVFYKSTQTNILESKYAYVFSSRDRKTELVPRLNSLGVLYYFEYGGNLFYHSGVEVKPPKYSNEEKAKALGAALAAFDLLVNKRINLRIEKTNEP